MFSKQELKGNWMQNYFHRSKPSSSANRKPTFQSYATPFNTTDGNLKKVISQSKYKTRSLNVKQNTWLLFLTGMN